MQLDLSQIVGVLANIGVIAGIVFLAVEVKQNNRLLAAQARYSLRQYRSDIADTIMSPHSLEATHSYATDENVTPAKKSAALMTALKALELWEWQHEEYVEGMLQRKSLPVDAWRIWFFGKGQSPVPFQEIWELRKDVLNPEFVRFFQENVIDRGPT